MPENKLTLAVDNTGKAPETDPEKLKVYISVGEGRNLGRVNRKGIMWRDLARELTEKNEDQLYTDEQFHKLPLPRQAEIKSAPGFIVGGVFDGKKRLITKVKEKWLLTFDIDDCSDELFSELFQPFDSFLADLEYAAHTTRSHTPEKRRVRLAIPLGAPVDPDTAMALTRLIACRLDPEMLTVDRVSFRAAQIMYRPSCNRGTPHHRSRHNRGALLVPADILAEWDGKPESLPRHPDEPDPYADAGKIGVDSRTKRGIIGAFCRVFDVQRTMEELLQDHYEATDDPHLYRYRKGTGLPGVRVYDDNTRVYSYHGTDPAGGKNLHTFDLCMYSLFGDLQDEGEGEKKPITETRMYKEMVKFARAIPEVAEEEAAKQLETLEEHARDADEEAEEDDSDEEAELTEAPVSAKAERPEVTSPEPELVLPGKKRPKDWLLKLDRNPDTTFKPTLANVIKIISYDRRFRGAMAHNDFAQRNVLLRPIQCEALGFGMPPVRDKINGDALPDNTYNVIQAILESSRAEGKPGYGISVGSQTVQKACDYVCMLFAFHPVQQFLKDCLPERTPDVGCEELLPRFFHAEDNSYTRDVSLKVMVGAVARIFEPGHKFDFMMTLAGIEGLSKSFALSVLFGDHWFVEIRPGSVEDTKRLIENIKGKWCGEIPELAAFKGRENASIKQLLSGRHDTVRLSYAHNEKDFARQIVFIGTVNPEDRNWMNSDAANRRHWPVNLPGKQIDVDGLRTYRAALWADAYAMYLRMRELQPDKSVPLMLDLEPENKPTAHEARETHIDRAEDQELEDMIQGFLETLVPLSRSKCLWRASADGDDEAASDDPLVLRQETCVADIVTLVLRRDYDPKDRRGNNMVARALNHLPNWKLSDFNSQGKIWSVTANRMVRAWVRTGPAPYNVDDL